MRGQTTLAVLGVALLLLAMTTTLGIAVADGVLADADRAATDRQAAVALSERLVSNSAPLTLRRNVVDASRARNLTAGRLREVYGVPNRTAVTVRLGNATLVQGETGHPAVFERIVLVRSVQKRSLRPNLTLGRAVTIPRRTSAVTVELTPPANTTVSAVRANDRVALRNRSGLRGAFTVGLSRFETTTLSFRANGSLPAGSVRLRYRPPSAHKARLEVRVDA